MRAVTCVKSACIASRSIRAYVTIGTTAKVTSSESAGKKLSFVAPALGSIRAYDEALKMLEHEQAKLNADISALSSSTKPEDLTLLKAKKVELGYTSLENHWKFNAGAVDFSALKESAETFEVMKAKRFKTVVLPKLVKLAESHQIYVDAFPGKSAEVLRPKVNVEVNFQNTAWEACYGQPIPPNWALYSPKVTINTHSDKPGRYTLVLMDLDRPSLSSNSIQEWCHWLVTDIPVTNRLTIEAGSSPFLGTSAVDTTGLTGASFHPTKPSGEPVISGNVVLPYVPPHPANSNPRKTHRYLLTVFEQQGDAPLNVQLESIRDEALNFRRGELDKKVWEKDIIGEKEEAMKFIERGGFSTFGLGVKHGLTVAGYAFFTAGWNLHTPDIFSRLGIHEPVYGEFPKNPLDTVHKITQATHTAASTIGDKLLTSLSLQEIQRINSGIKPVVPRFKLPTRSSLKAEELKAKTVAAPTKVDAKSSGKGAKGGKKVASKVVIVAPRVKKMPRLTTVGSVAVVRSKEGDVAGVATGDVTKSVFEKRGRYHNV
ncbi:MFT2-Corn MFT-like protein [Rhizoclosmatium sp. JEL0117]|nr:MFT2-Corn MFT-like protein [Rhizoclosmatium sp. JEL0117]